MLKHARDTFFVNDRQVNPHHRRINTNFLGLLGFASGHAKEGEQDITGPSGW